MADIKENHRLAFLAPKLDMRGDVSLGILKKVEAQVRAFRSHGLQTELLSFAPYRYPSSLSGRLNVAGELLRSHAWYTQQFGEMLAGLKAFRPDAVYVRYCFAENQFIRFLQAARNHFKSELPVFLEIPTFPYEKELRSSGNLGLLSLYYVDKFYRGKMKKYVDHIVTFGDFNHIFGIPTIKIGNGVDTYSIRPTSGKETEAGGKTIRLIGVSNLVFWVGYDRLIRGLQNYTAEAAYPQVHFDLVGDGPDAQNLRQLAEQSGLGTTVTFHGPLFGSDLDTVFDGASLAMGNLAGHRRGLATNPDLKNREYCARGLPLVTSTIDPGFPEDCPFVMRVPADDTPVDVKSLIDFLERLRDRDPDYRQTIRNYAVDHLDWSVMLTPVAEVMQRRIMHPDEPVRI